MGGLRIAAGLELPIDIVTQSMAILARRGAGKTYAGSVLAEEVIKARVPICILDPTGAWWGLRSSIDGTKPGLPVVIFGGDHGDLPLERKSGTLIANVVLEHPGAYIIDFSAFESRAAEIDFATYFLERLYRGKKRETGPLLLVVDEADTFAPQNPFGDERKNEPSQKRTLGSLESIVRRGRLKGLGGLLITQRSAVLNKNVLSQTEILIAMQNTAPQDRSAIDDWVKAYGTPEQRAEVMDSIASLGQGEAWFWSPTFLKTIKRVQIRRRTTFDSSRTPEVGEILPTVAFAKIDLAKLGAEIQATAEQAKANDPKVLQAEIQRLRLALSQRPAEQVTETIIKEVKVPVLTDEERDLASRLIQTLQQSTDTLRVAFARAESPVNELRRMPAPPPPTVPPPPSVPQPKPVTTEPPAYTNGEDRPVKMKTGARRMLEVMASLHPTPLTRAQVAMLSDISLISGTVSNYLSMIRPTGWMVELPDGKLALSETGQVEFTSFMGTSVPTPQELVEMWGRKMKDGAKRMLELLVEAHPNTMTRDQLAEGTGVSKIAGTVSNYLSMLRRAGLLNETGEGIAANDSLFIGQTRVEA